MAGRVHKGDSSSIGQDHSVSAADSEFYFNQKSVSLGTLFVVIFSDHTNLGRVHLKNCFVLL